MEVKIGNRTAEIELISKEGNNVSLSIDGEIYEIDVTMVENGLCSILHQGHSYTAELIRMEDGKKYKVNTHFSSYNVDIIDSKAKYLRLKNGDNEIQDDKIISPMPGKIVSIPVKPGDKLKAGDTAIVIEAMKMQSNYKVNSDCTIKEILVNEGDAVNSNQTLILLDLNDKEK